MSTPAIIATCASLLLLAVSVIIIWWFDGSRIYDHISRSLVQIAIATATVLVAFTIYDKQMQQRDAEELRREHLIVASYLRSKILEAQTSYKSKGFPVIGAADVRCDIKLERCFNDPDYVQETAATAERWAAPHISPELDHSLAIDTTEVWQLMRSAPLVDATIFNRIIFIVQTLENEARPIRWTIKRWQSIGQRPLGEFSRNDKVIEYLEMVRHQSRGILATVRAVCGFNNLLKKLETGTAVSDYDDTNITCPPDSVPFDDFFQKWKSGRDVSFKDRRDEKSK